MAAAVVCPLLLLVVFALVDLRFSMAKTQITVTNKYRKEVNVKIQGSGVGGCDIILAPAEEDTSDCWCLWGTVNYSFCAYDPKAATEGSDLNGTAIIEDKDIPGSGRCPKVTGESILCNDLTSLGNCYDGSYSCLIDSSGLCHCSTV